MPATHLLLAGVLCGWQRFTETTSCATAFPDSSRVMGKRQSGCENRNGSQWANLEEKKTNKSNVFSALWKSQYNLFFFSLNKKVLYHPRVNRFAFVLLLLRRHPLFNSLFSSCFECFHSDVSLLYVPTCNCRWRHYSVVLSQSGVSPIRELQESNEANKDMSWIMYSLQECTVSVHDLTK